MRGKTHARIDLFVMASAILYGSFGEKGAGVDIRLTLAAHYHISSNSRFERL